MDPYRDAPLTEVEAPRDTGIVGDVIAQFADPHAFLRELVQNAIDAGSPSVEVRLDHDAAEQLMRIAVRDRGEGMTRDVVENQLLVLFRSTKEHDPTKIGKFGIGFASVLAPRPRLVTVTTVRDGHRLVLHLRPDLSYGLYDGGPATQAGTVVELEVPVARDAVDELVARCAAALRRWCRHATTPIELAVAADGVELARSRIDQPLALDKPLLSVRGIADDRSITAVVGITGEPYAGFFNHGLTLHETTEPLAGRLAFKVQDARLGHTLSRDNVRRDAAFDRALWFVRELAERALPRVAARALADAAVEGRRKRYAELVDGLRAAAIVPEGGWPIPLLEPYPVDGGGTVAVIAAAKLGTRAWGSAQRSALTAALAEPVVDLRGHGDWLVDFLRAEAGCRVVRVERELTSVRPLELSPSDHVLLDRVRALLAAAHRAPTGLAIAEVTGALDQTMAFAAGNGALIDNERAASNPFGLVWRRPLVLTATHPTVAAARELAVVDPALAASHLARAILVHYHRLDVAGSEVILEHTLDELGVR